jgi:DNA-binding beta-propeller fold protein YncE
MGGRHATPGRPRRPALSSILLVCAAALAAVTVIAVIRPTGRSTSSHSAMQTRSPARGPAASQSSIPNRPTVAHGASGREAAAALAQAPWLTPVDANVLGHLRARSNPAVLPSALLIVDKFNNRLIVVDPQGRIRWQFPRPGDLAAGQTFLIPDDAFFTPDGRYIIATQEDQAVITLIDIARHRILYRYGVPGQPAMTANHLDNPDDAMVLPNGDILTADIRNCRLVLIAAGAHQPLHVIGLTTAACLHNPPSRWGSPNGVFPMPNGHYLVTEINGNWVDEIGLNGTIYWSAHPPGVAYPSDSNQIGPDRYLTVDYSQPGQVVIFDRAGRKLWSYQGTGAGTLNHPSLALPLPNGDIVLNDDYNHRVIVIDPRTDKIVWQYGITGAAGSAPGYLNNPDGIDLVPPQSLLVTHAAAMGSWP